MKHNIVKLIMSLVKNNTINANKFEKAIYLIHYYYTKDKSYFKNIKSSQLEKKVKKCLKKQKKVILILHKKNMKMKKNNDVEEEKVRKNSQL